MKIFLLSFSCSLQGGPGSSSTGTGNLEGIGPKALDGSDHPYTWVIRLGLLFLKVHNHLLAISDKKERLKKKFSFVYLTVVRVPATSSRLGVCGQPCWNRIQLCHKLFLFYQQRSRGCRRYLFDSVFSFMYPEAFYSL